jgi:hypothetical protein
MRTPIAVRIGRVPRRQWLKAVLVLSSLSLLVVGGLAWAGPSAPNARSNSEDAILRGNAEIARYMETNWDAEIARGIPYPARSPRVTLHGSWHQMGVQYGREAGRYVRIVYDAMYGLWLRSGLDPQKLPAVIDLYVRETRKLSPEMVQFIQGIAQGARDDLATATHADALDDFRKVFFLNSLFEIVIPSAWPLLAELMGESPQAAASLAAKVDLSPFASHSWAVWGSSTPTGTGIAGGTRDQPWFPLFYSVAYVAVPADPQANVVYGNTISGLVAASAQVNDRGVFIGNTIIGGTWRPQDGIREQDLGVPALIATAYVSFFADSAPEAAAQFTVGTEAYRRLAKRETLAYTVGFNQLVADANTSLVVERTAHRFAIREAGDFEERGPYLVLTNHNLAQHSFDESGRRSDEPMTTFGSAGGGSSSTRYYALFWEIANSLGRIDDAFAVDVLARLKHYYTPEGEKVTEQDGIPVWRLGLTPERFNIENPADPEAFPRGGNLMYVVADLESLDIFYTQGIPSHWVGPWDHVWLGDPAYQLARGS